MSHQPRLHQSDEPAPIDRTDVPSASAIWQARPMAETVDALGAVPDAIDASEATRRLDKQAPDRLPESPRRSPILRLIEARKLRA